MIGYCVEPQPKLASYRLRVAIPAPLLGRPHAIGCTGNVTFFYKNGNQWLARALNTGVVYDVVNDHFSGQHAAEYHGMCAAADVITCASPVMAEIVKARTGKDAIVIDDPYENDESPAEVVGDRVVWFGHQANYASLKPYEDLDPWVLTGDDWSLEREKDALYVAAVVMLTGNNPGASANRPVKAIRAGRFVVAPEDSPSSWKDLRDYMWMGDVREGIDWALNNREDACSKIRAGQKYIAERFNPTKIAAQWTAVFDSI
ncbi:MAG TPA: hypothetical protein VGI14_04950 [Casimicrobiaceae bacterium]|jgi:hypothetical protein